MDKINVGGINLAIDSKGRAPRVIGKGRRMTANFTLTRIATPGRSQGGNRWDGAFTKFKPFDILDSCAKIGTCNSVTDISYSSLTIAFIFLIQEFIFFKPFKK